MGEKIKKVLIIEDEAAMARALKLKLENEGFQADIAANGEKGLENIQKDKYNLIILDLMMPGMDGFEFLTVLKKKKVKIPIIISSNLSQEEDRKKCIALGAKKFLVKSETPIKEIVLRIKNYIK